MLCTCPNWNHRFNASALERMGHCSKLTTVTSQCGWDLQAFSGGTPGSRYMQEAVQTGSIQNPELMLGKDTVHVFQDACTPALVNADDGNNAFGRILAQWDWLFF